MAERTQKASKIVDLDKGIITFKFENGHEHVIDPRKFEKNVVQHATLHGFSQKFGDSYSGAADADEAEKQFLATLENMQNGVWGVPRSAGGGGRAPLVVEAIAQVLDISVSDARERYDALEQEDRKALATHPEVQAAKAQIQAQRAAEKAKEAKASAGSQPSLKDALGMK